MSTVLNRSSVKKYALAISAGCRASKFSRVGSEFYLRCEARLESEIRALTPGEFPGEFPPTVGGISFITKVARDKATEKLELLAQRIIYSEVMKHPSIGKTLK